MGVYNSSITRVWPVFEHLFHRDASGVTWLPKLLDMANATSSLRQVGAGVPGPLLPDVGKVERALPSAVRKDLGEQSSERLAFIRNAFEVDLPPSDAFLRWLLEHPERLTFPNQIYGQETQEIRERLLQGDAAVQFKGLRELERRGASGSRRKWWAFEGFTSVDCLLETESLVLLIEGKRTEKLSAATDWFPQRNQLARNVEVAASYAAGKKDYAVLVCAESQISVGASMWSESLPHLSAEEIADLSRHYLGCLTWAALADELCGGLKLPDKVDDAVAQLLELRR